MQRGFTVPVLLLALLLVIFGAAFYLRYNKANFSAAPIPKIQQKQEKQAERKYTNGDLGIEFLVPEGFSAAKDTEEDYNNRGNGNFRKNFADVAGYEPAKVLGAVSVLNKDKNFENSPFSLWVFENPGNLSAEAFFERYWYYPFIWGDFNPPTKKHEFPGEVATISGQLSRFAVINYRTDKPKMIYLPSNGKMYLFKVLGDKGEKVLGSFKLLNQDKVGEWTTYTSSKYGFSFKHPNLNNNKVSIWGPTTATAISCFADPSTVLQGTDAPFNGFCLYFDPNDNKESLDDYIKKQIQILRENSNSQNSTENITEEEVLVGRVKGRDFKGLSIFRSNYTFVPWPGSKSILVIARIHINESFESDYKKILETFKFL